MRISQSWPSIIIAALLCLIVLSFQGGTAQAAQDDAGAIVRGNNAFALELYSRLQGREGNIFFSPYSISLSLAMADAGARGDTAEQISEALHFPGSGRLHKAFSRLVADISPADRERQGTKLRVANGLWAQKGYPFLESFIGLLNRYYRVKPGHADFLLEPEVAREEINTFIEEKTGGRIKEMLRPGALDMATRLVLVNAIYFRGRWRNRFERSATREAPFLTAPDRKVTVPMMSRTGEYNYMEDELLQAIELPYDDGRLSMVVLLPKGKGGATSSSSLLGGAGTGAYAGVGGIEKRLDLKHLNGWIGKMEKRDVSVYLPRFRAVYGIDLKNVLTALGIRDAFDSARADFSGMDGRKGKDGLYISLALHRASVEVDEEGTKASAATVLSMTIRGMPAIFRADHPFLFLIRDNHTGGILFMGRVVEPAESGKRRIVDMEIEKAVELITEKKARARLTEYMNEYKDGRVTVTEHADAYEVIIDIYLHGKIFVNGVVHYFIDRKTGRVIPQ